MPLQWKVEIVEFIGAVNVLRSGTGKTIAKVRRAMLGNQADGERFHWETLKGNGQTNKCGYATDATTGMLMATMSILNSVGRK